MTEHGQFVSELSKACAYPTSNAAIVAPEAFIGSQHLGQKDPAIVVNAWRW